jgi:hypothetical protein
MFAIREPLLSSLIVGGVILTQQYSWTARELVAI